MKKVLLAIAALGCGAALSACSGEAAPSEPDAPTAASAWGRPLTAADLPKPKRGQWRTRTVMSDGSSEEMVECLDGEAQMLEELTAESPQACSRFNLRKLPNGVSIDTECASGGVESSMKGVVTGDFQTTMNVDIELGLATGGAPMEKVRLKSTSRYEGACRAGE